MAMAAELQQKVFEETVARKKSGKRSVVPVRKQPDLTDYAPFFEREDGQKLEEIRKKYGLARLSEEYPLLGSGTLKFYESFDKAFEKKIRILDEAYEKLAKAPGKNAKKMKELAENREIMENARPELEKSRSYKSLAELHNAITGEFIKTVQEIRKVNPEYAKGNPLVQTLAPYMITSLTMAELTPGDIYGKRMGGPGIWTLYEVMLRGDLPVHAIPSVFDLEASFGLFQATKGRVRDTLAKFPSLAGPLGLKELGKQTTVQDQVRYIIVDIVRNLNLLFNGGAYYDKGEKIPGLKDSPEFMGMWARADEGDRRRFVAAAVLLMNNNQKYPVIIIDKAIRGGEGGPDMKKLNPLERLVNDIEVKTPKNLNDVVYNIYAIYGEAVEKSKTKPAEQLRTAYQLFSRGARVSFYAFMSDFPFFPAHQAGLRPDIAFRDVGALARNP
jgi:hypothetical protein